MPQASGAPTPHSLSTLPTSGPAKSSTASNAQPSLPRSLAQISMLPALQPLEPPSTAWLREFFADLQPQHPQVVTYYCVTVLLTHAPLGSSGNACFIQVHG